MANTRPDSTQMFHTSNGSAVTRSLSSRLNDIVSVKDFGAVGDGVTDDTAAVQEAINFCLLTEPPATLTVSGSCLIGGSLQINRVVDAATSNSLFTIKGDGVGSGFITNTSNTIFTSSIASTYGPVSQAVQFIGVTFKSLFSSNVAYCVDGNKFLRMFFANCSFNKIKVSTASWYYQSWYFENCKLYGWQGVVFGGTGGAYDVKFDNCLAEAGGTFFSITCDDGNAGHPDPILGCVISNTCIESMTTTAIKADRGQGLNIRDCYFEGNASDIVLNTTRNLANQTPNASVSVTGCIFSPTTANLVDTNYYCIQWGRTNNGVASGNYVTSGNRLHGTIPTTHITFVGNEAGQISGISTTETVYAAQGLFQPGGGEAIRLLRGNVNSTGVISAGTGFTVVKQATGSYQVTFTQAFATEATLVVTPANSNGVVCVPFVSTSSSVSNITFFNALYAPIDTTFSFIVIGRCV